MLQFHKLKLERYSSAIAHCTAETTIISRTRKKTRGNCPLCRTWRGWAKTNWSSGNGTKKQIGQCRFAGLTAAKGLITLSKMCLLSSAQKWGQLSGTRWLHLLAVLEGMPSPNQAEILGNWAGLGLLPRRCVALCLPVQGRIENNKSNSLM